MSTTHDIVVVATRNGDDDFETINLNCDTCSRLIYASDAVDPGLDVLTKAASRHRRKPEWIEQSVARLAMEGW